MWKYMVLVAVFCAVYQIWRNANIEDIVAVDRCPFCYGNTLCSSVYKGRLSIGKSKSLTLWEHYNKFFSGAKNVFYGMLDKSQEIMLKNLGHDWELREFDSEADKLLVMFGVRDWNELSPDSLLLLIAEKLSGNFSAPMMKLLLCSPDSEIDEENGSHILDEFLNRLSIDSDFDVRSGGLAALLHIWSLLHINPEPIILQLFPSQGGWPFPEYLGACGRLVAEEYCGEPLSAVAYNLSWEKRALLASQALTAAHRFTHGDSVFRLYLVDISPDNVVVMEDIKGIHLKFVDLEDTILVDKRISQTDESTQWHETHLSRLQDDCPDGSCFVFSAYDICSHHLSDHNYFAVCNQLFGPSPYLQEGLLRPFPEKVRQNEYHSQLDFLLKECMQPTDANQSRESIALELQQLLEHLAYYL
ncbi:divergent protein kinase domain 2A-like [Hetaerina americana]|uniref:divergent protein kinase domain 2A-like n=1 Tax=Hetaerina americana TaxID=62018 RepID=UPI003A7F4FF8